MQTLLHVLIVLVIIALIAFVALYFYGRKLQQRQIESQKVMESYTQVVSMLVIDKKKMRLKEAPLPADVAKQAPFYMRFAKVGIVKGKIGPKLFNLMCDSDVYSQIPVKQEIKIKTSGLYIQEVLKGAVLDEKALKKRQKQKQKAAKKAAKEAAK